MNDDGISKIGRRSFLKKTSVLIVAASQVSLFAGLSNASDIFNNYLACFGPLLYGKYWTFQFRYNEPLPGGGWGDAYCYEENYCGTDAATHTDHYFCTSTKKRRCGMDLAQTDCYSSSWKKPGDPFSSATPPVGTPTGDP